VQIAVDFTYVFQRQVPIYKELNFIETTHFDEAKWKCYNGA